MDNGRLTNWLYFAKLVVMNELGDFLDSLSWQSVLIIFGGICVIQSFSMVMICDHHYKKLSWWTTLLVLIAGFAVSVEALNPTPKNKGVEAIGAAIDILSRPQTDTPESKVLKEWALNIFIAHSPVKLSDEAINEVRAGALRAPGAK